VQVNSPAKAAAVTPPKPAAQKKAWPYNLFAEGAEIHPGRK